MRPLLRRALLACGGLRLRLALSYLAFFAAVLVALGFLFDGAIERLIYRQSAALVEEEWGALRTLLRIEDDTPIWPSSTNSSEQSALLARLRDIFLLTDAQGRVLEASPAYRDLAPDPNDRPLHLLDNHAPRIVLRRNRAGDAILLRRGLLEENGRRYFAAIGYPLDGARRLLARAVRHYFYAIPALLAALLALGWLAAGRALRPLHAVASAAARVSMDNLSLRIPPRGPGDELDSLIHSFNAMIARLEQNLRLIRQFSAGASHELRTPLTAIRGHLEVALLSASSPGEFRAAIETALLETDRLSRVVNSLLLLSQAETGQLALHKTPTDAAPAAASAVEHFRLAAAEKHIRLLDALPASCPAVLDLAQFSRLLHLLLSNAVKFTPPGGEIRVTLSRDQRSLFLSVSDNGPGIPPADLPHIFDRFYRVPSAAAGAEPGAGLGLTFADWIVRAHGGAIDVKSEPGQGAHFLVTLPAGDSPHPAHVPVLSS